MVTYEYQSVQPFHKNGRLRNMDLDNEDKLCQRIRNIGSRIHVSIVLTYDISIASSGPKIKYHHDIYDSIINYNYDGYYVNIKLTDNKKVI